jgi:hypothetical protein
MAMVSQQNAGWQANALENDRHADRHGGSRSEGRKDSISMIGRQVHYNIRMTRDRRMAHGWAERQQCRHMCKG